MVRLGRFGPTFGKKIGCSGWALSYACPSSFLRLHAVSKGRRAQFTREEKILASV